MGYTSSYLPPGFSRFPGLLIIQLDQTFITCKGILPFNKYIANPIFLYIHKKIIGTAKDRLKEIYDKGKVIGMRFGLRKPSLKKKFKANTTGKWKRKVKRKVVPFYGKKGMGYIKNPKRAVKNKVYNKVTFSFWDLFK